MPFKSEKQRRYLWANEPEIARDWTDTYGSRIQAALGGIMASRVGFQFGGNPHEATQGSPDAGQTSGSTGGNDKGGEVDRMLTHKFAVEKPTIGMRTADFFRDYIPFVGKKSLSGRALRGIGKFANNIFTDRRPPPGSPDYNRTATFAPPPPRGGEGISYIPPYLANLYPRNIVDEDVLDIDTSTGNMEDWSQRFRVDNPYRQDQGALDDQIREYVSKLYT